MNFGKLVICALLGVLTSMLFNYLYVGGIAIDTLLTSIGAGLTITDIMIINFILWVLAGLWLASHD